MNPLIIDFLIVLILLLCVIKGYRKGFILTLCGFLALFVALIGASILSELLAEPVAKAIRPMVEQGIYQVLENRAPAAQQAAGAVLEEFDLPLEEILSALRDSAVFEGLAQAFEQAVNSGAVEITASAVRAVAEYAALQIARIVLFLLSFVAILILWFLLSHALDLAFHLPGLSFLNRWSGAALGLVKGAFLVWIACRLLQDSYLNPDLTAGSYLLPYVYNFHLLDVISMV